MKKKLILFLCLVLMGLPLVTNAKYYDNYSTMNLVDTLKAEGMEIQNKNYKETNDQAVIYMFRGQGCGFCRKFLTFINSISNEYGKYFKLVSFEVWNDAKNAELFNKMSNVTGVATEGVPYVIIGSKVFDGYAESYDQQIKDAIKAEYDKKDTDIFDKLKDYDDGNFVLPASDTQNDGQANNYSNTSSSSENDTFAIIFWNAFFVIAGTCVIVYFQIKNKNEIMTKLKELNNDKKETKKKKLGD